ncbi:BPTI/Kunitz domain-containing protein isoform X1 [Acanthochromis polyacanthus]|uniref:BPTI/Kunitz domain-containing protein isoform X1 n=1 Tax=Acanthochromis polyacanthus TaxID=80966 RepID=UPI0022346D36|nr:BPTI/Kunitz domain-containing protein isoform X1 [Acanthochromis polyacanthus]
METDLIMIFVPEFCMLPSDGGTGPKFDVSLYYNHEKGECNPFLYYGSGGNANRFANERECIRNCSADAEKIYPMDETEACLLKKKEGGCNGKHLRYYYDSIHDKCKKFLWTGCIGNGNRFFDFDSCNKTCAGIHEDGDDPEEDEPDTPIAIICGVLLALIIAAIIITVVVLTVQSNKKKSKKKGAAKSKDGKAESPLQTPGIEMA